MQFTFNPNFWNDFILIGMGFLFFLAQMIFEAYKRREKVNWKLFGMQSPMIIIAMVALNAIGPNLPAEYFPWSPVTIFISGYMPMQIISGLVRYKKPADVQDTM
jgi:hypothetical protein